jgi:hypothetical protein
MRRLLAPALLVLAVTTVSSPAAADAAVEHETARALMDDGDRAFRAADFASARASYLQARALVRAPTTGLAVAEAEERLGRFVEARDSALEVTRMPPAAGEPPVFAESRELARALAARVLARIGVLVLTLQPDAACGPTELSIDGARWPAEALGAPLRLDPGPHRIQARAEGCEAVERSVEVPAGASLPLVLELHTPSAAAKGAGALDTPPPMRPPAAPREDAAARRSIPTGALALMGIGVVGVAVGVTAGAVSLSKTGSVREACGNTRCAAGEDDYQAASSAGWIANGGFAVGVLGGAAGVIWWLLDRRAPTSAQVTVGPRGAGLVVPFF